MQRASNIAAALAIGLAVIAMGGVHTVVVAGVAVLAIAGAGLQIAHLRSREHRVLFSLVGVGLFTAALLSAIQIIAVPPFVHALLNPHGLELYETGRQLAGLDGRWRPLSLDPQQTADRCLRFVALAAIALWAANVRGRRRWQAFAYGFVPLALTVLGIGYALWAGGAQSFFGLYTPTVGFRGPSLFISTNHGAAFYGLAMLVGAAAALRLRHDSPRRAAAMALGSLVLAGAAVAMDSDGVLIALAAAAIVGVFVQWMRRGRPRRLSRDVGLSVLLLGMLGGIAAIWLDLHRVLGAKVSSAFVEGEHGGRVALISAGAEALGDFWRFGAGAGSVETVIPAYVDWSAVVAASIPVIENDPLEVALAFGVVIGLALVITPILQIAAVTRYSIDGKRSPRYAVALVAGVYFALVAQLHFPLFALGIGLPAIAWFELLWSRRTRPSRTQRVFRTGHLAIEWPIALGGCVVLAVVALWAAQAHWSTYAPARELPLRAELAREQWIRPANHAVYVKLATQAARSDDFPKAVKLADHAVTLEPSPRVRLYRAQVLARAGDPRGMEEFGKLFAEGHKKGRYTERFLIAVDDVAQRAELLAQHPDMWFDAAKRIRRLNGPDGASSFVVALAEIEPDNVAVYRLGAVVYLELRQPVLAELWAEIAQGLESSQKTSTVEAPLLLARALRASGRLDDARRVLDEATKNPALVRDAHRVGLELRGAPNPELQEFVKRHYDAFCVSPIPAKDQRLCWNAEAWLLETTGDYSTATRVYRRLYRRLQDPMPLAQFFVRTGRCDELLSLSRDLDPGPIRRTLDALHTRCQ